MPDIVGDGFTRKVVSASTPPRIETTNSSPQAGAGGQNVDARGARNHGADPPQADAVRIIALGLTAAYWAG